MSSVVRSFSFPADDLDDLQDLAEEHGGWSQLFQDLYKPLLAYRAKHGRDPEGEEIAALAAKRKAEREEEREQLARLRKEKAQRRAKAAEAKIAERVARKRAAFPTPEKLGEAHAYATTAKLQELAQEYAYDVEEVLLAAQRRRARDEAEAEARIRPMPATFDEWVDYGLASFRLYKYDDAVRNLDRIAREHKLDRAAYARAVTNKWRGQQNLPTLVSEERGS
ncbi:MAG TPA: hypothetical protein VFH78_08665 [Candidatus Thermoplasmatota archaeon]|nr:hypothetical protein [Candidatus Thermoplasmatota archaeon]